VIYRTVTARLEAELAMARSISMTTPSTQTTALSQATPDAPAPVPSGVNERESAQLMRALGQMLEGSTPSNIPERIIHVTLQSLQADVGVLLIVRDANYADTVTGYDRLMQRPVSSLGIRLAEQPTLVNAIERQMQRPLYVDRNSDELRELYSRLDIEQLGPTYLQPLVSERRLVGVLLIGLPYSERELTLSEQELLKGIGIISANLLALSDAARSERVQAEEKLLQAMVQGIPPDELDDGSVMSAWQEMQASLDAARDQIMQLTRQVTTLKVELDYERSRVADALGDTEEGQSATRQLFALNEEQQRLREERDLLSNRLREAETALAGATATDNDGVLKAMIEVLRRERDELNRQRETLEGQLETMRAASTPMPQMVHEMLERMSVEKVNLEAERDSLKGKLMDIELQLTALGVKDGAAGLTPLVAFLYEQRALLQNKNAALQRERDALLNERTQLEERITQEAMREKQLQTLQTALKHLAADREELTKQRDRLRVERDDAVAKIEAVKQQRARLMAESAGLEAELAESNAEAAQLRVRVQRLTNDLSAVSVQRDQLLGRLQGSSETAQPATLGDAALRRNVEALTAQRDSLQRELEETRARLSALEAQAGQATAPPLFRASPDTDVIVGMLQELRTPMTGIIGFVDLLASEGAGILGDMQRDFLQRISANARRMGDIVEDVVRMTAVDSGNMILQRQPVDVVSLIDDMITAAAMQLRNKGLDVDLDMDEETPPALGDRNAVRQIIGTLLTNAVLASPPGSAIRIAARVQNGNGNSRGESRLAVSVEDRGGGVQPEDYSEVFERRYRADAPLVQGLGDTGVGLSIAKALVEAQGGQLWLESRENVGSVFTFTLPLARVLERQG
jgi:signal transduction histidine kinase